MNIWRGEENSAALSVEGRSCLLATFLRSTLTRHNFRRGRIYFTIASPGALSREGERERESNGTVHQQVRRFLLDRVS